MPKVMTIGIVQQGDKVLLGMKKRDFGMGHWNGLGGKVQDGETVEEAMKREAHEEMGLTVQDMEKVGTLTFTFESEPTVREAHVFRITRFTGEPQKSDEMRPQWFGVAAIPLDQMWPADQHWLPVMLAGKKFEGQFHYDQPSTADRVAKILRYSISQLE